MHEGCKAGGNTLPQVRVQRVCRVGPMLKLGDEEVLLLVPLSQQGGLSYRKLFVTDFIRTILRRVASGIWSIISGVASNSSKASSHPSNIGALIS